MQRMFPPGAQPPDTTTPSSSLRKRMWRWGPALGLMAVIFIASSFPSANLPRFGFWDVVVKKGGHLTGYALLAVAYLRALSNGGPISTRRAILAVGLAGLYAASDEFHQSFVPGRGAAAADVMIDAAGAVLGVGARMWVRRWMGV